MQLWLTTKATLLNERASSEALFVALVVYGASPIIRRCQGSRTNRLPSQRSSD